MNISGALGYSLLKSPSSQYVLVLSDVHDGVSYCEVNNSNNNIKIDSFLKSRSEKNNKVLLEETTFEEVNLKDLWPNAEHTQLLKRLAFSDNKINSFDIRPLLVPFSWELSDIDKKLGNTLFRDYLKLLDDFFNKKSLLFTKYIGPELEKIKHQKKKNTLHLLEIFDQYNLFKKNNKDKMEKPLSELLSDKDVLEKVNEIISHIMEWYMVLLILNTNENIIIHAGLAHTSQILKILCDYYKFMELKSEGLNDLDDLIKNKKDISKSCIFIPENITNKFNKKFLFSNLY